MCVCAHLSTWGSGSRFFLYVGGDQFMRVECTLRNLLIALSMLRIWWSRHSSDATSGLKARLSYLCMLLLYRGIYNYLGVESTSLSCRVCPFFKGRLTFVGPIHCCGSVDSSQIQAELGYKVGYMRCYCCIMMLPIVDFGQKWMYAGYLLIANPVAIKHGWPLAHSENLLYSELKGKVKESSVSSFKCG